MEDVSRRLVENVAIKLIPELFCDGRLEYSFPIIIADRHYHIRFEISKVE